MDDNCWGIAVGDEMPEGVTPEEISYNGKDVYITRVQLENGEVQPAKVVDSKAYVCYNGKELLIPLDLKYPVLVKTNKMKWVRVQDGKIPESALTVGKTSDGTPLYATRVRYPYVTDIAIGKVKRGEDTSFPFLGKERTAPDFDVLTMV